MNKGKRRADNNNKNSASLYGSYRHCQTAIKLVCYRINENVWLSFSMQQLLIVSLRFFNALHVRFVDASACQFYSHMIWLNPINFALSLTIYKEYRMFFLFWSAITHWLIWNFLQLFCPGLHPLIFFIAFNSFCGTFHEMTKYGNDCG